MTTAHMPEVRRASLRVALGATVVVAIAYLMITLAVLVIATRQLTGQIDANLHDGLVHISNEPGGRPDKGFGPPPGRSPLDPAFVVWTMEPDGTTRTSINGVSLPTTYQPGSEPQTIDVNGVSVRVTAAPVGDGYVVIGQSMRSVSDTQDTIILAALLIGPVLLIVVFVGAVAIGRRVAAPIERARQRQLEFTADASHELRTPVSVIEAHTSLALSQDRSAEWYKAAFGRVDNETRRMRRLLDDLLWLARFDSSGGQPHAEPVDLGTLAAQTADRFGIVAEARQLSLSVRAGQGSLVINAPPDWLDRLLGVLLDNACKYSPTGGSVAVSVVADGGRVRLSVDDSGPGIPEAERALIFDRFHRASETGGGSGLGLAIGDAIVRATGGKWRIADSAAGGASMSVSWPRAFPHDREASRTVAATPVPPPAVAPPAVAAPPAVPAADPVAPPLG